MILLEDELWSLPIGQESLKSYLPSKKDNIISGLLGRTIFKPLIIKQVISQICQYIFFFTK